MTNAFVISLDYELYWGIRDHTKLELAYDRMIGTRNVIPRILDLFFKYEIKCTWATVGILFAESAAELKNHVPTSLPNYTITSYNPYNEINQIDKEESDNPCRLGLEPLKLIANTKGQEIGTHTFSHYYCLEDGQTFENFESDLTACVNLYKCRFNDSLKSIVFPRNQFNENYIPILEKLGIKYYRGNRQGKLYKEENHVNSKKYLIRIMRFLDRYINLSGYGAFDVNKIQTHKNVINLPSSRFFSPFSKRLAFIENLKVKRIKGEMTFAAKNKLSYHLWWHPENFGLNSDENLHQLEIILKHYKHLQSIYKMPNLAMGSF